MLTQPTTNLQVNSMQVIKDNTHLNSDPPGFDHSQEPSPAEGAASQATPGSDIQVRPTITPKLK